MRYIFLCSVYNCQMSHIIRHNHLLWRLCEQSETIWLGYLNKTFFLLLFYYPFANKRYTDIKNSSVYHGTTPNSSMVGEIIKMRFSSSSQFSFHLRQTFVLQRCKEKGREKETKIWVKSYGYIKRWLQMIITLGKRTFLFSFLWKKNMSIIITIYYWFNVPIGTYLI